MVYVDGSNYCFSCNSYQAPSGHIGAFSQLSKKDSELDIPQDIQLSPKKFPTTILKWLYKYYITDDDIRANFIGVKDDRYLFLPILDENKAIVGYQLRNMQNKAFITYGKKQTLPKQASDTLVIVEDIISAIRCSRTTDSIALLGTNLSKELVINIIKNYQSVIVWLDGDKPGREACTELLDIFHKKFHYFPFYDCGITTIVTDKDPKEHSPQELLDLL